MQKEIGDMLRIVEMQWKIMQQKPDDYIIATGKSYSVKEFIDEACKQIGFKIIWTGKEMK